MITAVNPEEDTYLNVREMMYLMRLSVDFEIDYKMPKKNLSENYHIRCDFFGHFFILFFNLKEGLQN